MPSEPEVVSATAELSVAGYSLQIRMAVPTGSKRPKHLLPVFHSVADALVEVGVRRIAEHGRTISCHKGCAACCRQLVPLSTEEARQVRELVTALPEPQQSAIRERFAEARERLAQTELWERLNDPQRIGPDGAGIAHEYFALGIACPFLEHESCSIYHDRPLVCREYLVTSAPEHCQHPGPETVRCVKMPAEASAAMMQLEAAVESRPARWVPLTLALDWAETNPELEGERPGPELVREFFERLSGKPVNEAPALTRSVE